MTLGGRHRYDPCENKQHEWADFTFNGEGPDWQYRVRCCTFCGLKQDGTWWSPAMYTNATWRDVRAPESLRPEDPDKYARYPGSS